MLYKTVDNRSETIQECRRIHEVTSLSIDTSHV